MDEYEGGDSACWLSRVCPECGALLDDLAAPCWRCGLRPGQEPGDASTGSATR
ncbi:hypothetical protein Q9R19_13045 [Microbacterium sp. ARD32]|uniref:hypothetical protein n=1 Tax=Microbacterium sp. ARD32 TaxID=2962577 RepID=UPI002882B20C|nr:hypothetical protein [Microbacterium sp. ARD32]MDT0158551.1 hypothetical protein [Microbacterium sp. ARD32]